MSIVMRTRLGLALAAACLLTQAGTAQRPQLAAGVRDYVKLDAPVVVLTHARVIDGTGAAPRQDQTIVLRDGAIAEIGAASSVAAPSGATVIDLTGKTALERAFAKAGGRLIAGTDPTGGGGVVPGYSNQRQLELLVEAGFSPLEAIRIGTLNGAEYLGRDKSIGSIAVGKQADLIVVDGNPAQTIADVRRVETVFRQGVGYDPVKLVESVRGRVGLW